MDSRKLSELRAFVRLCKQNPGLLHTEELAFLREWVESGLAFQAGRSQSNTYRANSRIIQQSWASQTLKEPSLWGGPQSLC